MKEASDAGSRNAASCVDELDCAEVYIASAFPGINVSNRKESSNNGDTAGYRQRRVDTRPPIQWRADGWEE